MSSFTPPQIGRDGVLDYDEIVKMRDFVESFGLQLEALENLPGDHLDRIVYARPGREEQMEKVGQTIRNMGRAGVPILGYLFGIHKVCGHWRAYDQGGGRGNCGAKSFDIDRMETPPGDDPPIPYINGVGRLLHNHETMQQLIDLVPSPNNGLEFCQGTVAEMGTEKVLEAIRRFGSRVGEKRKSPTNDRTPLKKRIRRIRRLRAAFVVGRCRTDLPSVHSGKSQAGGHRRSARSPRPRSPRQTAGHRRVRHRPTVTNQLIPRKTALWFTD